ncbi:hypothetical protein FOZ62_012311 [Perkinsus olseni]|uniref:Uncharacterized protein n=1 Tax=Perkinsus olseni TaxID=32597 RepID=A0A7J6NDK7_PEROL|nr:hypothetical protein FOZ62_012311 [Perkinsus olseni]
MLDRALCIVVAVIPLHVKGSSIAEQTPYRDIPWLYGSEGKYLFYIRPTLDECTLTSERLDPPLRKPGMCQVVHVAAYCERRADLDVDVYVVSKDDWKSTAYRSRIHYHDKLLEFDKLTPQGDSHVDTVNLTSRLNRVKGLYELDSSISNVPWRANVFYGVDEDHKREIYFDPETGHCRMEKQQTAEERKEEKMQMKEMMKREWQKVAGQERQKMRADWEEIKRERREGAGKEVARDKGQGMARERKAMSKERRQPTAKEGEDSK